MHSCCCASANPLISNHCKLHRSWGLQAPYIIRFDAFPISRYPNKDIRLCPGVVQIICSLAGAKPQAAATSQLSNHPAAKYGLPVSDQLRGFEGYVSNFDPRTRNPQWVLERITRDSSSGEGNRYALCPSVARWFLCVRACAHARMSAQGQKNVRTCVHAYGQKSMCVPVLTNLERPVCLAPGHHAMKTAPL